MSSPAIDKAITVGVEKQPPSRRGLLLVVTLVVVVMLAFSAIDPQRIVTRGYVDGGDAAPRFDRGSVDQDAPPPPPPPQTTQVPRPASPAPTASNAVTGFLKLWRMPESPSFRCDRVGAVVALVPPAASSFAPKASAAEDGPTSPFGMWVSMFQQHHSACSQLFLLDVAAPQQPAHHGGSEEVSRAPDVAAAVASYIDPAKQNVHALRVVAAAGAPQGNDATPDATALLAVRTFLDVLAATTIDGAAVFEDVVVVDMQRVLVADDLLLRRKFLHHAEYHDEHVRDYGSGVTDRRWDASVHGGALSSSFSEGIVHVSGTSYVAGSPQAVAQVLSPTCAECRPWAHLFVARWRHHAAAAEDDQQAAAAEATVSSVFQRKSVRAESAQLARQWAKHTKVLRGAAAVVDATSEWVEQFVLDMSQRTKASPSSSTEQCGGGSKDPQSDVGQQESRQAQYAKWKRQPAYVFHDPQSPGAAPDLIRPSHLGAPPSLSSVPALRALWVNASTTSPPTSPQRGHHRGAAADPRATCRHRNALLSMATMYGACDTNLIAQAFVRYATPCDFFIPIVNRGFVRHGVLMHRHVLPRDGDVLLGRTYLAHVTRRVGPDVARIAILQEWARESAADFHYVIQSDARDATIMGNLFAPLYDLKVQGLFATREVHLLENEGLNRRWITAATEGKFTLVPQASASDPVSWILGLRDGQNKPPPVMCSGLYGGTGAAFKLFLDAFAEIAKDAPDVHGIDQGYFNVLFYIALAESGFPYTVNVLDEGVGPYRHWYQSESLMSWSPDGRLLNCDGAPYGLVHQLDRYGEWGVKLRPYKKLISTFAGDVC